MPRALRVVQMGLGPIGLRTARAVLDRQGLRLTAVVDPDPALAGRDLGSLLRRPRLGLQVAPQIGPQLRRTDVVLHTTVSSLVLAIEQLRPVLEAGVDVVSSTEEMAFPWWRQPAAARRLDRLARKGGATILGVGVKPGFALDLLPLVLSHSALEVRSIRALRVQDASTRRLPLRLKVGAGLTPTEFRARARAGSLSHVGLRESMDLLAAGLGWRNDRYEHSLKPVLARRRHAGPPTVSRGQATGQRELLRGFRAGHEILRFELVIALDAPDPRDEVVLAGNPPLRLRIEGGTPGDIATTATLLNAVPRVVAAEAGLRTPLDLPVPRHAAAGTAWHPRARPS